MLNHLYIKNFAIIPSLELDFQSGFTAITGETGAGKSILVDALGLLLGKRSDSSWVRQDASKAELTADFSLEDNSEASSWLTLVGLDSDEHCLLRRTIGSNGRSRAWINGTPVTVQQLVELGGMLVEIHGQNEHVNLKGTVQQFQLLDSSGDYQQQLSDAKAKFAHWKELDSGFKEFEQKAGLSSAELDYLAFQLRELETHSITAKDLQSLENEHRKLAQGGEFVEALDSSVTTLDSDSHGVTTMLQNVISKLQPYLKLDDSIKEVSGMLSEAAVNCQEAALILRNANDRIDLSPERLTKVTGKLGVLADLARKHQVEMEELTTVRDQLSERIDNSENFDLQREAMEAKCEEALKEYRQAAENLSVARSRQAKYLSTEASGLMSGLGMPGGVLEIDLQRRPDASPSANGDDAIELLVSANPGVLPGPIAKIASGGELSRISLAIKVASSATRGSRTQIFDEVDAGIGGDTANAVGVLMQKLAQGSQALCVTHLAQVAVCADQQLQVSKQALKDETHVETVVLDKTERIDEIARMLGGRVSDQSRKHASEMLSAARLH
jgi:DNA repair protein RecN (Recombination protein N)